VNGNDSHRCWLKTWVFRLILTLLVGLAVHTAGFLAVFVKLLAGLGVAGAVIPVVGRSLAYLILLPWRIWKFAHDANLPVRPAGLEILICVGVHYAFWHEVIGDLRLRRSQRERRDGDAEARNWYIRKVVSEITGGVLGFWCSIPTMVVAELRYAFGVGRTRRRRPTIV
jgi:hypothetical protein